MTPRRPGERPREERPREVELPELGLLLRWPGAWQLGADRRGASGNVYQRLPDDRGLLFVRWGEGETLDRFLAGLASFITEVEVRRRSEAVVAGAAATRVEAVTRRQEIVGYHDDPETGLEHEKEPARTMRIVVLGFELARPSHHGVPVLLGYRVEEASFKKYRRRLERALASARPAAGQ